MGSEAALEAAAARLQGALTDHGCRGTPACEGLSGATKVAAVFAPNPALSIAPVLAKHKDCMCAQVKCPPSSSLSQSGIAGAGPAQEQLCVRWIGCAVSVVQRKKLHHLARADSAPRPAHEHWRAFFSSVAAHAD